MTDEELIAALEAAEGPTVDLFLEVYESIWPHPGRCYTLEEHHLLMHRSQFQRLLAAEAWLDAALTLVPEGCEKWDIRLQRSGTYKAALGGSYSYASTPAIALCIAALKARSS